MSEQPAAGPAAAACARLLAIVEAQAEALAQRDVAALVRLTEEREAVAARVGDPALLAQEPRLRDLLLKVAALDEQNLSVARNLLLATGQQLQRVGRGQVALRGYGGLRSYLADRPTLLDRRG